MSESMNNLDSFASLLCQKAVELGAAKAVTIPASNIVLDERAQLKCFIPICHHYGSCIMCPPNVMSVSKFREILNCYHVAMMVRSKLPEIKLESTLREAWAVEGQPPHVKYLRDHQSRFNDLISEIEILCFTAGYRFAAGLTAGGCILCDECVAIKSGERCRYPFKARPPIEAVGIDVVATTEKAGMPISFKQDEAKFSTAIILID